MKEALLATLDSYNLITPTLTAIGVIAIILVCQLIVNLLDDPF